ncbi:MAG TPA: CerR family C-terminal domain-containing protein [Gaiellaceae bacterium]|nr:CerR family C-terminal domain-containing protein [Gaiellaceae bacterium]
MKASSQGDGGRGEATRRRLIDAAIRVFGESGYHAVGTRELAEAAGANQAAIPYYFGGKDGLHQAAARQVATVGRAAFAPLLERMDDAPAESLDRDGLADLTRAAFRGLTRGLIGPLDEGFNAAFIVREQVRPGPAFDILFEGYIRVVHEAITSLVSAARGFGLRSARSAIEAHALIGSAMAFVVARPTLCRRLEWDGYTPRRVHEIEEAVVGIALRALDLSEGASSEVRS